MIKFYGVLETLCCYIMLFMTVLIFRIYRQVEYKSVITNKKYKKPENLLIVAHPDDEFLFFMPLILNTPNLTILCLTSGNNNYFKTNTNTKSNNININTKSNKVKFSIKRCKELKESSKLFDFNFKILNLNDENENNSKEEKTTKRLTKYIKRKILADNKIENVYTFGNQGVTKHSNHILCNKLIENLKGENLKCFTLRSFNLTERLTTANLFCYKNDKKFKNNIYDRIFLIVAFKKIYRSQFNFMRMLNILLSCYMKTNYFYSLNNY